jgi:hypothetical protein
MVSLVDGGNAKEFGRRAGRSSGPFSGPVHSRNIVCGVLGGTFAYIKTLGGCLLLDEAAGEF